MRENFVKPHATHHTSTYNKFKSIKCEWLPEKADAK